MRNRQLQQSFTLWLLVLLMSLGCISTALADNFKIGIMQAQAGAAKKYAPLEEYLETKNIHVKFVTFANYSDAATMFEKGAVDGMFSGSGVAGAFLIRGIVTPLVRPVDTLGRSTYWAVVIGRKGDKPFAGTADYFKDKRVAYSAIASSGEFFYRAIPGIDRIEARTIVASNHQDALDRLNKGEADLAIIKNMVWDSLKAKYPNLEQVGQDGGQNPNETLIVSKTISPANLKAVLNAFLAIGTDPGAAGVRESMGVKGFILTTTNDFSHTLGLLKRAGVTPQYDLK